MASVQFMDVTHFVCLPALYAGGTRAISAPAMRERASAAPSARPPPIGGASTSATAASSNGSDAAQAPDLPREADIMPVSANTVAAAFFASRGISEAVLERNGVGVARVWSPAAKGVADAVVFPYRRAGAIVNCKFRAPDTKIFWQTKGGDKVVYGLDDIADAEQVIIVEGEMDKLAMEQAGFRNCISVPDGARAVRELVSGQRHSTQ